MRSAFNLDASVRAFGSWVYPTLKHQADLDRYATVIASTQPTAVVEAGTRNGASADWFATNPGVRLVVTIDIQPTSPGPAVRFWNKPRPVRTYGDTRDIDTCAIHTLKGSSTWPDLVAYVEELTAGHRVMVSLDSDHSRDHVFHEIERYAPLVSPGCYLVVEDGIIAFLPADVHEQHGCGIYTGTVLDAIGQADRCRLLDAFEHDAEIEGTQGGITMNPGGWWRKRQPGEPSTGWQPIAGGLYWAPIGTPADELPAVLPVPDGIEAP
jgi:cephalosporin hydroxylase